MSVCWHPRSRSAAITLSLGIGCGVAHGSPRPCGGVIAASYRSPTRVIVIAIRSSSPKVTPYGRSALRLVSPASLSKAGKSLGRVVVGEVRGVRRTAQPSPGSAYEQEHRQCDDSDGEKSEPDKYNGKKTRAGVVTKHR